MRNTLIIIILLVCNFSFSQDYRFGKVGKEELMETSYAEDPTADAVVLFKQFKVSYDYTSNGFVQVNEIYERIKIYNKSGYEWATKKEKLYDKSATKSEKIKGLKGCTYNLVGSKVEKTKLKKESIFEEKNNEYWATTKFTMPNVSEGSIIEFEYRIESPYISIDNIDLQYTIPIKNIEVSTKVPEFFIFKKQLNLKAAYQPSIRKTKVSRNETSKKSQMNISGSQGYVAGKKEYSEWKFFEDKTEIKDTNVPALKKEPFVNNLNNYAAKLILEYTAYKGSDGIIKDYSTTWDKVSQNINKNENFGGQLSKTNYFKDDIDALIKDVQDPIEKTAKIYNYVKSKMKWDNFVGYRSSDGLKNAYKEGSGSVGDINLMLTAMLRYAELDANPVLTSTKDNGIPIFPTTQGFNYVITAVQFPDGIVFLDATNTYGTVNILPFRTLNWQGRLVRENGDSNWMSLAPKMMSKEVILINGEIHEDFSVTGKIRNQLTNYNALEYRNKYYKKEREALARTFEGTNDNIEITNLKVIGEEDLSKPIVKSYDYLAKSMVEDVAGKLYVSPMLHLTPKENPFKQDERLYPVDFIYPQSTKYLINLKLPEGYEVESMPESAKVNFNESEGDFSYLINQNNNSIQITIQFNLNTSLIAPTDYEQFKKLFELMIEKETEKIVLKKSA